MTGPICHNREIAGLARAHWTSGLGQVSGDLSVNEVLLQMAQEVHAGRAVIARVVSVDDYLVPLDHAVRIRSIEQFGTDWRITVNDPATGTVILLNRDAWRDVQRGAFPHDVVVAQ